MAFLTRRTAWEAAISAVVSAVLSFIVFTPIVRFIASGWSGGDMLSTYVNAEMWQGFSYRVTNQMGFPLGMDLNYFPGIDITENLFAQLVTNLTGKPFIGINLLIIVTFPIVAALAYLAIRMTRLQGPIAIALAVAFSLIPYHWGRSLGHTYLSTMYSAVTGMILVLLIGSGWLPSILRTGSRRKRIWVALALAALMLVTAWTGVYYAAFTLLLAGAALVWRLAKGDSWRALAIQALPIVGILGFAIIGFIPALLARHGAAPLAPLGDRLPYHSVMFAGLLVSALLPAPISVIPGFGSYNRSLIEALGAAPAYENTVSTNFGTWITTAALAIFVVGVIVRARTRTLPTQRDGVTPGFLAMLIGWTTVLFVPWGINYLIAGTVTAQIRGWNRLLPFLLMWFILGAALMIRDTRFVQRDRWALPITGVIIVLTAIDSVIPFRAAYAASAATWAKTTKDARAYATTVNEVLPAGCGILQLPYFAYPEHGVLMGTMNDYDHFWTSLLNPQQNWSYGAVKNTTQSVWAAQLPQTPTDEQLTHLASVGFCAIHLDTNGYEKKSSELVQWDLSKRLGKAIATGADGRWQLYRITDAPTPFNADESTWSPTVRAFLHQPFIQTDPVAMSMPEYELTTTSWWLTHHSAISTITPIDPQVPVRVVRGKVAAPTCTAADITVTIDAGGEHQSTVVSSQPGKAQDFAFTLKSPSQGPVLLTVDAADDGCLDPGIPQLRYARVLDLSAS